MNTRTTAKQKTTRTTAKKTEPPVKTGAENAVILKGLPMELLTPEQSEAVTAANYYHPEDLSIILCQSKFIF